MKIIVKNKIVSISAPKDKGPIFGSTIKTGFLICDGTGKDLGVIYKIDAKGKPEYGKSHILFNENHREEKDETWKIVKDSGVHLPFAELESIMKNNESYEMYID